MRELIVIDYIHCISGEFLKIGKIGKIVGDKQSPLAPIYPPLALLTPARLELFPKLLLYFA